MGWREEASAEAKDKKAGANYTMEVGENSFRIMPNKKGTKFRPYVSFRLHRDVGPEKAWVMCGRNTRGEGKCYLCDKLLPELEASSSDQKREMANKMRPKDNLILQVSPIDPRTKKFMPPKAYWAPYTGGRSLGVHIVARLGDVTRSAIDDPVNGRNLTVERTGSGLKTRYGPLNVDEEKSEVPKNILAMIKPLEELVPVYNPKRQLAAYKGEKFEDYNAAPPEDNSVDTPVENDEEYQLDEPQAEGAEDLPADDAEDFGMDAELEPDPGDDTPQDDELGDYGEGFDDDLPADDDPDQEPEPVAVAPAPRRQAPAPAPRRTAPAPAAPTQTRRAAPAPAAPVRTTRPAARPATRAAQPTARGGKPPGRR